MRSARADATTRQRGRRKVAQALHTFKRGSLHTGRSGAKVRSRKQALAIGLAEARHSGARVAPKKPPRRTRRKRQR